MKQTPAAQARGGGHDVRSIWPVFRLFLIIGDQKLWPTNIWDRESTVFFQKSASSKVGEYITAQITWAQFLSLMIIIADFFGNGRIKGMKSLKNTHDAETALIFLLIQDVERKIGENRPEFSFRNLFHKYTKFHPIFQVWDHF